MLISLCVPTFNRECHLEVCLEALASALNNHPEAHCFEVCVSDNASTDGTAKVIERFRPRFTAYQVQRHSHNTGFAGNYLSLFSLATGDWVVVLGDDDIVSSETLNLLVRWIGDVRSVVLFRLTEESSIETRLAVSDEPLVYDSLTEVFESLSLLDLSFIGDVVIPRNEASRFVGSIDHRSAYPSVSLVVSLAKHYGLVQVKGKLIRETGVARNWVKWQPIYTSVDAVRIIGRFVSPFVPKAVLRKQLLSHLRSLPRAIMLVRLGVLPNLKENPYRSITVRNVYDLYSPDYFSLTLAILAWLVSSTTPLSVGRWILGISSEFMNAADESTKSSDMCVQ